MSNLPYNPDAGNGITHANELYSYMKKYPLCVFDIDFMESYGPILCKDRKKTIDYYMDCMREVQLSGDLVEMIGRNITTQELGERAFEFSDFLNTFSHSHF